MTWRCECAGNNLEMVILSNKFCTSRLHAQPVLSITSSQQRIRFIVEMIRSWIPSKLWIRIKTLIGENTFLFRLMLNLYVGRVAWWATWFRTKRIVPLLAVENICAVLFELAHYCIHSCFYLLVLLIIIKKCTFL